MKELHTEIDIEASAARVWALLRDFEAYPEWNPFVRSIRGELRPGAKLNARLQPPEGKPMSIAPTLLCAEPERELRWRGSLPIPGLFQGEHIFELQPLDDHRTRFVHRERFSGLLIPLLWKKLLNIDTRAGFEAMNRALKQRAEQAQTP